MSSGADPRVAEWGQCGRGSEGEPMQMYRSSGFPEADRLLDPAENAHVKLPPFPVLLRVPCFAVDEEESSETLAPVANIPEEQPLIPKTKKQRSWPLLIILTAILFITMAHFLEVPWKFLPRASNPDSKPEASLTIDPLEADPAEIPAASSSTKSIIPPSAPAVKAAQLGPEILPLENGDSP